jgi:hypothetical protein
VCCVCAEKRVEALPGYLLGADYINTIWAGLHSSLLKGLKAFVASYPRALLVDSVMLYPAWLLVQLLTGHAAAQDTSLSAPPPPSQPSSPAQQQHQQLGAAAAAANLADSLSSLQQQQLLLVSPTRQLSRLNSPCKAVSAAGGSSPSSHKPPPPVLREMLGQPAAPVHLLQVC